VEKLYNHGVSLRFRRQLDLLHNVRLSHRRIYFNTEVHTCKPWCELKLLLEGPECYKDTHMKADNITKLTAGLKSDNYTGLFDMALKNLGFLVFLNLKSPNLGFLVFL